LQRKSNEFGFATLELRFMWIPDGYAGLRPGYPWFAAGRLSLGGDDQNSDEPAEPAEPPDTEEETAADPDQPHD